MAIPAYCSTTEPSTAILKSNWFLQCRMNATKSEPESDSETQESLSEFQFIDVNQDVLSIPMSCTEMKTEIEVSGILVNGVGVFLF